MKNIDVLNQKKADIMVKMNQAITEGNEEEFTTAFNEFTELLQEAVMAEAKGLIQAADNQVLAGRGVRALTSKETKYYQKLIEAMKSPSPKQALTEVDLVLPETVIDAVFEDITESHPLLDAINFQPTGALIEIIVSTLDGRQLAAWGKLCDEIVKKLSAGFDTISLTQNKLSAFMPICKAMLDLGPVWIDRYVRAHLSEAIYNGLEKAIVDGSGLDSPVGMRRNPNSALDPWNGYDLQPLTPLGEISPQTYGALIADLSVAPTGLQRTVKEVVFIVSPKDYFTKIFPSTTYRLPGSGEYVNDIFPFPTRLIQSVWVPEGEAVIGLGKRYFMGIGTSKGGRIEYSDEYRFLEDERMYLTKLYGDGRPLDSTSFKRLDISNLQPFVPNMNINNWPPVMPVDVLTDPLNVNVENDPLNISQIFDARLASLKVGALVLSPAFNKSIMYYEAATTDATNKITAAPMDGEATIEILHGVTPVANGDSATWEVGENTVAITVTSGTETETYTVVVTKS